MNHHDAWCGSFSALDELKKNRKKSETGMERAVAFDVVRERRQTHKGFCDVEKERKNN